MNATAYIAGPISGHPDYKEQFNRAEQILAEKGYLIMNPAILPEGFEWEDYMKITLAMLDACRIIVMLPGWQKSKGAIEEYRRAYSTGKIILEFTPDFNLKSRVYSPGKAPNKNNH